MKENYPPYLEQYFQNPGSGLWVGSNDEFAPQLKIIGGPSLDDLIVRYRDSLPVNLRFTERTGDMDFEDPDIDVGEFETRITRLFEDQEHRAAYFMGRTAIDLRSRSFLNGAVIWVWDYDGKIGFADFEVK